MNGVFNPRLMKIGLRIDVDTFRGTRDGVPALCRMLAAHSIAATFFFSVGPDNMGRHLWRLARPQFLIKMLRSRAANLYGWDILLRGTFWPGALIGKNLGHCLRMAAGAGHEIGLHAWDHYTWQARTDQLTQSEIQRSLALGVETITALLGAPPVCSAAPGWRATEEILSVKEKFNFRFNSDCRGQSVFQPVAQGRVLTQPQIPTTLPTYDEIVGRDGVTMATYNDHLLALVQDAQFPVLTIHAEVEGIACRDVFKQFIQRAQTLGHEFTPLGSLLPAPALIPPGRIEKGFVPGREGWVAVQKAV
jgi:undecaprenyl phosphate-alpha-L-ara4FN deformylase